MTEKFVFGGSNPLYNNVMKPYEYQITTYLIDTGVEGKYWGEDLTKILKEDGKLLTV